MLMTFFIFPASSSEGAAITWRPSEANAFARLEQPLADASVPNSAMLRRSQWLPFSLRC